MNFEWLANLSKCERGTQTTMSTYPVLADDSQGNASRLASSPVQQSRLTSGVMALPRR